VTTDSNYFGVFSHQIKLKKMKTIEKIVWGIMFIIVIIGIPISAYKTYQIHKEVKEMEAQQQKAIEIQQQKAIEIQQQKALVQQKAEQQLQEQKRITKLFIAQLKKKNINNLPFKQDPLDIRANYDKKTRYDRSGFYAWKFCVTDEMLHFLLANLANKNIGKDKFNNKNSILFITIDYHKYFGYQLDQFSLELRKPAEDFIVKEDYYIYSPSDFVLNKEMMDSLGIVLW
jgi:hypothetical protein